MSPVDDYLDAKEKSAAVRDAQDLEAWQSWKAQPTPQNLQPLMKRFEGTFGQKAALWKAPNVNEAAFKANLMQQAMKAFENYDPNRGASLRTHVTGRLSKSKRFNVSQQNMAYIPEQKTGLIGPIDSATDRLRDELGRDPTDHEIGLAIGQTPQRVAEIRGLRRADIPASSFESDPISVANSRHQEVVGLLRPALGSEEERAVFDYMYGQNGKPQVTSTSDLARRLGKSPSQISRLRRKVEATYKKNL